MRIRFGQARERLTGKALYAKRECASAFRTEQVAVAASFRERLGNLEERARGVRQAGSLAIRDAQPTLQAQLARFKNADRRARFSQEAKSASALSNRDFLVRL